MSTRTASINIYLVAVMALLAAVCAGCSSPEKRRMARVHYTELWLYEGMPESFINTNQTMAVVIADMPLLVRKTPFLTEEDLEEAAVVDSPGGGYALQLRFNFHGRLELSAFSGEHRGQHMAIFARYGVRKKKDTVPLKETWLAAPLITRPIPDGVITFTPNAAKEEVYSILDGLRNAIELSQKPWVF